MDRDALIKVVESGRSVIVLLQNAKVLSVKTDWKSFNRWRGGELTKVVVSDPVLGNVWFGSFSEALWEIKRGQLVSLKVKVTGVGKPSDKFPKPLLFAKALTRGKGSVIISNDGNRIQAAP